jgi:hypothetical protein
MPAIDVEAERRRIAYALAKSRRKGDFITCDAPMSRLQPTAAELEAEEKRKAEEEDRWWRKSCGPW